MRKFPTDVLKNWFIQHRRPLPWREDPTPYRVWISEVMLQQTQVAVVIPYFERWMEQFPSIQALAAAPIETVLKCWEGLGYYSRARNLHRAAQDVVARYQGQLPDTSHDLATIPGIGPYTQGAILSFAFRKKAAAVDGNVLRVLSRYLALEEEIDAPRTRQKLQHYAENLLPQREPWLVAEGLIELGALVCTKKARCDLCPITSECLAYRHQMQDVLPKKKARPKTTHLVRQVAVIRRGNAYFVQKGATGKIMADLYEFPYLEGESSTIAPHFENTLGIPLRYIQPLPEHQHTFTRYKAFLYPHLLEAESTHEASSWKSLDELHHLPFSSGHKRILADLKKL